MRKKKPWILKEPNFIPHSSKIRLIMFLVINGLLIGLLPLLAVLVVFPYGYLCWVLVICVMILFNIKAFHIHTERYPLNKYSDYQFNSLRDRIKKIDGIFVFELQKISKSEYLVLLEEKQLYFDMKRCICPMAVLKAYLIRQFTIKYINKYKLNSDFMGKNINISKMYKEYENIFLSYKKGDKTKKKYLVKSYRTKMHSLEKSINGYGYVFWYATYHGVNKYHTNISENDFVDRKNNN